MKQYLFKIYILFLCSNASENGQKCLFSIKTVGIIKYRYRLVHWWVAETLLNVQSESFLIIFN